MPMVDWYEIVGTDSHGETVILFHWHGLAEYGVGMAEFTYREIGPLDGGPLYDFRAIKLES